MKSPKTIAKQRVFLRHYAENGNVRLSAVAAGVSPSTARTWIRDYSDHEFQDAYEDAREEAVDRLEEVARRLATEGHVDVAFTPDGEMFEKRRISENMLKFLMTSHAPHRFGKQSVDVTHTHIDLGFADPDEPEEVTRDGTDPA